MWVQHDTSLHMVFSFTPKVCDVLAIIACKLGDPFYCHIFPILEKTKLCFLETLPQAPKLIFLGFAGLVD